MVVPVGVVNELHGIEKSADLQLPPTDAPASPPAAPSAPPPPSVVGWGAPPLLPELAIVPPLLPDPLLLVVPLLPPLLVPSWPPPFSFEEPLLVP